MILSILTLRIGNVENRYTSGKNMTDWERETAAGRAQVPAVITSIRDSGDCHILVRIVRDIVRRGHVTARDIGLFYGLAVRLISSTPQRSRATSPKSKS